MQYLYMYSRVSGRESLLLEDNTHTHTHTPERGVRVIIKKIASFLLTRALCQGEKLATNSGSVINKNINPPTVRAASSASYCSF